MRSAVFLDRDGVINDLVLNPATGRMESPLKPEDVRLPDGVLPALFRLQEAGFLLILVSNQPNYALGKSSLSTLNAIHASLESVFTRAGIHFSHFCYCLHHPKGNTPGYSGQCDCRKPSPWFLFRMRDAFDLSLAASWMVGDQPTDVACGRAAGVRTIRIASQPLSGAEPEARPDDLRVADLACAAELILSGARR